MKIAITAGHSDTDPGAIANGFREADIAERMRNGVAEQLRALGHEVVTDGTGLYNLPLGEATKLINGSALAVEFHCNSFVKASATGVECIGLRDRIRECQAIAAAIGKVLTLRLRGIGGYIDQSQSHRGKLGFVGAGGVIVEAFFLSNPDDLKSYLANEAKMHADVAAAIHALLSPK